MYRNCIFCSAELGSNESIEQFPVGRSLAFDASRGRLWAICPKCARWNLAPIEERWETIEHAEGLFRDTRTRVQSEHISLAKLRDGTRLVRVGAALPGELAAWRYGNQLVSRRRKYVVGAAASAVFLTGWAWGTSVLVGTTIAGSLVWNRLEKMARGKRVHVFPRGAALPDREVPVDTDELRRARLVLVGEDVGLELRVGLRSTALMLAPVEARSMLRRGLVHINASGAGRRAVSAAVELLAGSGSAQGYLRQAAARRATVAGTALNPWPLKIHALALEMAIHEDLERQALEGEFAALKAAWRQAEEIAAIADRLPDDVSAADPPRIG